MGESWAVGETPGLATATVQIAGVPVQLGVVDYGGSSTYLLVPGVDPERLVTATAVLKALETAGALHILHPQSSPSPATGDSSRSRRPSRSWRR